MHRMALTRRAAMLGCCLPLLARPALATPAWRPTQTVKLIVSAAPGGTQDIHARAAAPVLSERIGQTVVIENNGTASGRGAGAIVARAAPDGHTLLVASGDGLVLSDILFGRQQGLLRPRLAPVTLTIGASQLLVTHPSSGIRSVGDYVAEARRRRGALTLGVPGHGGIAHVISEMLNRQLGGVEVVHVPYRGGGPATLDLMAGQLDAMIITLPAVTAHVRAGRLVPLAVSTAARDPAMPEVPTPAETVAPGFDVPSTQGILLPAATPAPIIEAWHQAWRAALFEPVVHRRLSELGFIVTGSTPADFLASITDSERRFATAIEAAGIRAETV